MPNPLGRYFAKVYGKLAWEDNWVHLPNVACLRAAKRCSPGESQAQFVYDYGVVKRQGSNTFANQGPLGLQDAFIKVSFADYDGNELAPFWHGVVPRMTNTMLGGVFGGRQTFQALGLEHILDRVTVSGAYVLNKAGNQEETKIDWFPGFNEQLKKGMKGTEGNRSSIHGELGPFCFSQGWSAKRWNAHQAVEYLLAHYAPSRGMNWQFAGYGQYEALQGIEEVWNPGDSVSLLKWLNLLIDRRRGVSFYIEPDLGGGPNINIVVFTVVNEDLQIGNRTLPANNNQVDFTPFTTFPETHLVKPIEFTWSSVNLYDTIEVRGERLVCVGTFSFADQTLIEGWDDQRNEAYYQAAEESRITETWAGVWTRFIVPEAWDRKFNTILDQPSRSRLNLHCDESGVVTDGSDEPGGPYWHDRQRMARTMPIEQGISYALNPPAAVGGNIVNREVNAKEFADWMPLMAICRLPDHIFGGAGIGPASKWRMLDRLSENETGLPNCHVRPLDRRFGFELEIHPRHLFARQNWPKDANGAYKAVARPPLLSFQHMAVTAAVKCDARLRVQVDTRTNQYTEEASNRHLVIDVPGAEYWRVVNNAVIGLNNDATLARIHPLNKTLRDDRDLLDGIASFGCAWFGKQHQSVLMTFNRPDELVKLGALIKRINAPYNQAVNTVVTEIDIDFGRSGETKVQTGWGDYDLMGAVLDEKKGIASQRANMEWSTWE